MIYSLCVTLMKHFFKLNGSLSSTRARPSLPSSLKRRMAPSFVFYSVAVLRIPSSTRTPHLPSPSCIDIDNCCLLFPSSFQHPWHPSFLSFWLSLLASWLDFGSSLPAWASGLFPWLARPFSSQRCKARGQRCRSLRCHASPIHCALRWFSRSICRA